MTTYQYAQGLFDISVKEECLDEILHDFENFSGAVSRYPEWLSIMYSPMIKREEKQNIIKSLSRFNQIFLNFLFLLLAQNDMDKYLKIFERFRILARREQKIAHVRVVSAKPLTAEQYISIKEELHFWIIDKEIEVELVIDRRLIGGIQMFYEGETIDRSFSSQLKELKSKI